MTSRMLPGSTVAFPRTITYRAAGMQPNAGSPAGILRLPTDSIGSMTLTLTNVVIGSRIRIEEQVGGALVDERTATGTSEVFSIPVYVGGSAKNDLRIKVRKGTSAPKYQPFETLAVAAVGSQSVYTAQVADPIA